MNRTLRYLSLFCILISIPLTFTWATWEGNAGVAAASEFPGSGMYARSDMFPRNTIVDIINLETGSRVRAVITGASGVPGLVAQLSPDTANALNIHDRAVVRVRIKIPSPVAERPAPGTIQAEDALSSSDPDVNPEAAVASLHETPVVPLGSIVEAQESPMVSVSDALADQTFDDALLEANGDLLATDNEDSNDNDDITDEEIENKGERVTEPLTPTEETPVPESESVENVFYDEPALVLPVIPEASETQDAVEAVAEEEAAEIPEEVPVKTEVEVILEPAEPRIPQVEFEAIPVVPPVIVENTEDHDDPLLREALPAEPVEEAVSTDDFPWIEQLTPGALYVQIATYSEAHNVREILDTYGNKYPVCVKHTDGTDKPLLKVLIGPVKKDEYGAVLEYFKKNGFKDAFLKRGK